MRPGVAVVVILTEFIAHAFCQSLWPTVSNNEQVPGWLDGRQLTVPIRNGGLVFAQPSNELQPPAEAFIEVSMGNGRVHRVPKGLYQKTDVESEIGGAVTLPDLSNPLSLIRTLGGGDTFQRDKNAHTNGLYVPMPLGLAPINIQLLTENIDGRGVSGGVGTDMRSSNRRSGQVEQAAMSPWEQMALDALSLLQPTTTTQPPPPIVTRATLDRQLAVLLFCRMYGRQACERANRLHQQQQTRHPLKASFEGRFPTPSGSRNSDAMGRLATNLLSVVMNPNTDSPPQPASIGGLNTNKETGRSRGAYIGLPFFKPVYLGTYTSQNTSDGFDIGLRR